MSLFRIFDIAGSAMQAQTVRMNTTASNMANSETVAGTEEGAYRAKKPVFESMLNQAITGKEAPAGVRVTHITESQNTIPMIHRPGHPLANAEGYVYGSNVNVVEEMAEMISASRSYENSVQVLDSAREIMMKTLRMGQ